MEKDKIDVFFNIYAIAIPRAFKKFSKNIHKNNQFTFHDEHIFRILKKKGNCSMSDLSSYLALPKSNVTIYVNNLVENGYVERINSEEDRRIILVGITPSGCEKFEELKASARKQFRKNFSNFSEEDISALNDYGKKIVEIFEKYTEMEE